MAAHLTSTQSSELDRTYAKSSGGDEDVLDLPLATGYPPDDQEHRRLMGQVQQGDRRALQALIELFWAPLVGYATTLVIERDDAEDVVQETFVQVWNHRESWCPSGTVSAYLYRITRNQSLNALRSQRSRERWSRLGEEGMLHRTPPPTAEEEFERELLRQEVEAAILRLPERRREIFMLARYHGLTHREIAETLGISQQTVSNQMVTALTDLREALAHRLNTM